MQTNITDAKISAIAEEESSFDIRMIWAVFMEYKYWFIASVIVCVTSAMIYLRYTSAIIIIPGKNEICQFATVAQFIYCLHRSLYTACTRSRSDANTLPPL